MESPKLHEKNSLPGTPPKKSWVEKMVSKMASISYKRIFPGSCAIYNFYLGEVFHRFIFPSSIFGHSINLKYAIFNTLQGELIYPTKREVRKLINSKLPLVKGYVSSQEGTSSSKQF